MQLDLKNIAPLIQKQFPSFYDELGPNFIQFIQSYYDWMDQQGPTYKSRRLLEYNDIDQTTEDYINYFLDKFMYGVPKKIAADQKLTEKHILDLFRSKGSLDGLKLFFRLLYNLEVQVSLPKNNMFKPSDGKWKRNAYFEVQERPANPTYNKQVVTGTLSGATAFVTTVAKVFTGTNISNVMYITDITPSSTGQGFIVGESLSYNGLNIQDATSIIGSASGASVIYSSENHAPSDVLLTTNNTGSGIVFDVSSILNDKSLTGYITFDLINGGYGYAVDTPVSVSYLTASSGVGANFKVKSISNTQSFHYNTNFITSTNAPNGSTFTNTMISATNYGAGMFFANVGSLISSGLSYANLTIGSIASLGSVTSGDHNYNGSVSANVFESRIHGYGIVGSDGTTWGNNAVITGNLSYSNGVINTVELLSSGFGFNTPGEQILFYNQADETKNADLVLTTNAIGYEEGFWVDDSSFVNSDQYITDSDYYQDFSYEIQMEKSLDKYIDVLKQLMHPTGTRVFGKPVITDTKQTQETIQVETIVVTTL